eukprot:TRINITY_DN2274_c0_g1_i1.p1 TRINITY_DN2274_c0_g1~~TRINITY_DN2274_c0_g1_i1.p1  ORF type:complete len:2463 (-),score=430.43 TRINITY_DN2274_c0_g1_i1:9-6800(-)
MSTVQWEVEEPVRTQFRMNEHFDKWIRVAWSADKKLLAVATLTGHVFVLKQGQLLHTFDLRTLGLLGPTSPFQASSIAEVAMRRAADSHGKKCHEVVVVGHRGEVLRIVLPQLVVGVDPEHVQKRSLETLVQAVPHVCAANYNHTSNLLAVVSCPQVPHTTGDPTLADITLSVWRLTDTATFHTLVYSTQSRLELPAAPSTSLRIKTALGMGPKRDVAVKVRFSPEGNNLALLTSSRAVHIWSLEGKTFVYKSGWQQPVEMARIYESTYPSNHSNIPAPPHPKAKDIGWWVEDKLVLTFSDGRVAITQLGLPLNMLGVGQGGCAFKALVSVCSIRDKEMLVLHCDNLSPQTLSEIKPNQWLSACASPVKLVKHLFASKMDETGLAGPARNRQGSANRRISYKLCVLRQTSPFKLFLKKLELAQYDEALILAQTYTLNTDMIYQRQWAAAPVSEQSIKDYLNKIYDRRWVVWECHRRVPLEPAAIRLLLEYGIENTTPSALLYSDAQTWMPETELEKELVALRLLFLRYLERLDTFLLLPKQPKGIESVDFVRFRDCDLVTVARNYARDEWVEGLEVLLKRHPHVLLENWMSVLECLPETLSPKRYRTMLPHPNLYTSPNPPSNHNSTTPEQQRRDWAERNEVVNEIGLTTMEDIGGLQAILRRSASIPRPAKFQNRDDIYTLFTTPSAMSPTTVVRQLSSSTTADASSNLSAMTPAEEKVWFGMDKTTVTNAVAHWYHRRTREIDRRSGRLQHAFKLLKYALAYFDDPMPSLLPLRDQLRVMAILTYTCNLDISIEEYEQLNAYERLCLMMSGAKNENLIVTYVEHVVLPVLSLLNPPPSDLTTSDNNKDNIEPFSLLSRWIVEQTQVQPERLPWCIALLRAPKIFPSDVHRMKTTMAVMYANPRSDPETLFTFRSLFKDLPALEVRSPLDAERVATRKERQERDALAQQMRRLSDHLAAAAILLKYEQGKPLGYFANIEADSAHASRTLRVLAQKLIATRPVPPVQTWRTLLQDMLDLRRLAYPSTPAHQCYYHFVGSLLQAGQVDLAREFISKVGEGEAGEKERESLALEAARLHFNSAPAINHLQSLTLARQCLSLGNTTSKIVEEQNLHEAVAMLRGYGVELLPLQIRLQAAQDPTRIILDLLPSHPGAYKDVDRLARIGSLLGATPEGKRAILHQIAHRALDLQDNETAYASITKLMSVDYAPIWEEAAQLAQDALFSDTAARHKLAWYAMVHGPVSALPGLLALYSQLETQVHSGPQSPIAYVPEPAEPARESTPFTSTAAGEHLHWHPFYVNAKLDAPIVPETAASLSQLQNHRKQRRLMYHTPGGGVKAQQHLQALQSQLRSSCIATTTGESTATPQNNVQLLRSLAAAALPKDLPLGFSYLLATLTEDEADLKAAANWLETACGGETPELQQRGTALACYLLSLIIAANAEITQPHVGSESLARRFTVSSGGTSGDTSGIGNVMGTARGVYTGKISQAVKIACHLLPHSSDITFSYMPHIARLFRHYNSSLVSLLQQQQVNMYGGSEGVADTERMANDETYRTERLKSMAANTPLHPASFSTLLALARSFHTPPYIVGIEHFAAHLRESHQFTDTTEKAYIRLLRPSLSTADPKAIYNAIVSVVESGELPYMSVAYLLTFLNRAVPKQLKSELTWQHSTIVAMHEKAITNLFTALDSDLWRKDDWLKPHTLSLITPVQAEYIRNLSTNSSGSASRSQHGFHLHRTLRFMHLLATRSCGREVQEQEQEQDLMQHIVDTTLRFIKCKGERGREGEEVDREEEEEEELGEEWRAESRVVCRLVLLQAMTHQNAFPEIVAAFSAFGTEKSGHHPWQQQQLEKELKIRLLLPVVSTTPLSRSSSPLHASNIHTTTTTHAAATNIQQQQPQDEEGLLRLLQSIHDTPDAATSLASLRSAHDVLCMWAIGTDTNHWKHSHIPPPPPPQQQQHQACWELLQRAAFAIAAAPAPVPVATETDKQSFDGRTERMKLLLKIRKACWTVGVSLPEDAELALVKATITSHRALLQNSTNTDSNTDNNKDEADVAYQLLSYAFKIGVVSASARVTKETVKLIIQCGGTIAKDENSVARQQRCKVTATLARDRSFHCVLFHHGVIASLAGTLLYPGLAAFLESLSDPNPMVSVSQQQQRAFSWKSLPHALAQLCIAHHHPFAATLLTRCLAAAPTTPPTSHHHQHVQYSLGQALTILTRYLSQLVHNSSNNSNSVPQQQQQQQPTDISHQLYAVALKTLTTDIPQPQYK